jgi:hypothetical protein
MRLKAQGKKSKLIKLGSRRKNMKEVQEKRLVAMKFPKRIKQIFLFVNFVGEKQKETSSCEFIKNANSFSVFSKKFMEVFWGEEEESRK